MRSLPSCFRWFSALIAFSAAVSTLSGCGSSHDETAKQLAAMHTELKELQAHSDRLEERLETLELRKEALAARPATPMPSVLDHPKLTVVKLEPGDDSHDAPADTSSAELKPEDSANDKTPRPVIRVHGPNSDGDVRMASDNDSSDATPARKHRGQ